MKTSTRCRLLGLLTAASLFASCTRQSESESRSAVPDTATRVEGTSAEKSGPDPCRLAIALPGSLDTIARIASVLLTAPDSCVTALIDSLESIAGQGNSRPAIVALDSLAHLSDGYASEAISTAMPRIFRRSPETVARYLIDVRTVSTRPLADALVVGFSMERSAHADTAEQTKLDRHLFDLIGNGMALTPAERAYLDSLKTMSLTRSPG